MEKRSRRRIHDLVARPASMGLSENEIGCARISMMARNTNVPFKGRIQKRKTYHLQIITFRLQRAAGPYRSATSGLMHCTADEEARRQEKARDAAGNTSGASNTASATTQASGGGINGSYSTTFPLTENPISEGGSWTNGGATGLGWANVQTTPGLSFGTSPVNAGTYLYADPTAVLKNAWAQDQQVQATVKVRGAFGRACCKEVELLIRMTIARNSITGYELNCSVVSAGPYLTLVRWNGPLNNFTYIVRNATTSCVNGDVLKLTAVGNTFTVYKNGVQVLQGTDATFQKGSPGVGFYNSVDTNWSGFGLSNFSASNVGSSDTTPPRIQDHD